MSISSMEREVLMGGRVVGGVGVWWAGMGDLDLSGEGMIWPAWEGGVEGSRVRWDRLERRPGVPDRDPLAAVSSADAVEASRAVSSSSSNSESESDSS